ncbi:hypothetical protein DFJ74DRAFT_499335 [Hyaloraphidium curvatum]|nr:hypothetical protein DFJ74DRAFT_499335 [Hyaloraphidium curvatum]
MSETPAPSLPSAFRASSLRSCAPRGSGSADLASDFCFGVASGNESCQWTRKTDDHDPTCSAASFDFFLSFLSFLPSLPSALAASAGAGSAGAASEASTSISSASALDPAPSADFRACFSAFFRALRSSLLSFLSSAIAAGSGDFSALACPFSSGTPFALPASACPLAFGVPLACPLAFLGPLYRDFWYFSASLMQLVCAR